MTDQTEATRALAERFIGALAANDAAAYEAILAEDAGLRRYGAEQGEAHRPRRRVVERLLSEGRAWPDARLETLTITANAERAVVEFRVQATDPASGRYAEYQRAAVLTVAAGCVAMIDLYAPAPMPSAPRGGWIAQATLSDAEVDAVIDRARYAVDYRRGVPPDFRGALGMRETEGASGEGPHPGSNFVGGARWTEAEADDRIAAVIERYRARQAGFQWWVGPCDTPADLGQRLERQGLALAGTASKMVKVGLDDLDAIPANPRVTVERLDGTDPAALAAAYHVVAIGFNLPPEAVEQMRAEDQARYQDAQNQKEEYSYLARLGGEPAGVARLLLRAGVAYLGGAATLPEFRGQRVYSTLLRHRLEVARDHGYHLALIDAEPMSRRVVVRYGFVERGITRIYGWMPVMDLDVIRSLVPQD
jgi:hypothetical protein